MSTAWQTVDCIGVANLCEHIAAFAVVDAVVNTVLPQTLNSSIGLFTDLKFVGYGDSVKFRVRPRGLFVVSRGGMGERTTFRQKMFSGDVFVTPEERIVTVFTDMLRVLMGKEDIAEFVRLVVISIETAMGKDAAQALSDGISAVGYPSALQVSGAFNAQDLIELGELVQAYNYGVKPVILGTAAALSRVVPDSSLGFRGNFDANGGSVQLIKDFYGFNLMVLPQYAAGATPNDGVALPSNKLFVVSPALDKLVKGVVANSLTNSNGFYENADLTQNFTMRKAWEFKFLSGAWGGVYTITD